MHRNDGATASWALASAIPSSWQENAEPVVPQDQRRPDPDSEQDRKNGVEHRIADPHVGGGGAAEISGEEQPTERRRARNQIDTRAAEQQQADPDHRAVG